MSKWQNSTGYFVFLAIATLIMAVITYSGVIFKEDIVGRLLVGTTWLLVSIGWLGQYFRVKKSQN